MRPAGVPSIRTDIPWHRVYSVTDQQNYGDEAGLKTLIHPLPWVELGLSENDFKNPISREKVCDINILDAFIYLDLLILCYLNIYYAYQFIYRLLFNYILFYTSILFVHSYILYIIYNIYYHIYQLHSLVMIPTNPFNLSEDEFQMLCNVAESGSLLTIQPDRNQARINNQAFNSTDKAARMLKVVDDRGDNYLSVFAFNEAFMAYELHRIEQ